MFLKSISFMIVIALLLSAFALDSCKPPASNDSNEPVDAHHAKVVPSDEEVLAKLLESLNSEDPSIRALGAMSLGRYNNPEAVEKLINALDDDDLNVRKNVADSLTKIGEPAIKPLLTALSDNESWVIKRNAETILKKIDPVWLEKKNAEQSIGYYITLLNNEDSVVRNGAMDALSKIGESAIEPLIRALISNDKFIAEMSGIVLMRIDKFWTQRKIMDEMIPQFISSLSLSADATVRANASKALVRIGSAGVNHLIDALISSDRYIQKSAMYILSQVNPDWGDTKYAIAAIPKFSAALNDDNTEIRIGTVFALEKINDPAAIDALIVALKNDFPYTKSYAEKALKKRTGEDFGPDHDKWLAWWSEAKNKPKAK